MFACYKGFLSQAGMGLSRLNGISRSSAQNMKFQPLA